MLMEDMGKLLDAVEAKRDDMVAFLSKMISIPALGPENGGVGEIEKVEWIEEQLTNMGITDLKRYDAPDDRVPSGIRPNLVATVPGSDASLAPLWIVCHTDVVPPGEMSLWDTDPFEAVEKDGMLFGRGTEDNGQELVASLFAMQALFDHDLQPVRTVKFVLVADEELGSTYGIRYLVDNEDIFSVGGPIIVPDGGVPEGDLIETAEKSIVWLKVQTLGKQCHASMPANGINAHRAAAHYMVQLEQVLRDKYPNMDPIFDPPESTIEPTKHEANVDNINSIPGEDIFYFDIRLNPCYDPDELMEEARAVADKIGEEMRVKINLSTVQYEKAAPPTPADDPSVTLLSKAIKQVRGIETKVYGIGGGTCAAFFRRKGLGAVVWATMDEVAHEPNERIVIKNMVDDAKVYAALFLLE